MDNFNWYMPEKQLRNAIMNSNPELQGLEFDLRVDVIECIDCNNEFHCPIYLISGEEEWMPAVKKEFRRCKDCNDRRLLDELFRENKINLHGMLSARFESEYWGVPRDLSGSGFKNFDGNIKGNIMQIKNILMEYAKTFSEKEQAERNNIVLAGNTGVGKSHLAIATARNIKQEGFLVGFITTGTYLSNIRATYKSGSTKTENDIINDLSKLDLLVLDDLGSEAKSEDELDWGKTKLYELITTRMGKPTIYTINYNEEHLPRVVGKRVSSRLNTNTQFLEIIAEDYRKNFRIN